MYKIIVIDDESIIREGIINLFPWSQLGFEIAADFSDGRAAMDYIKSGNKADVVLTDIQMPFMNGIQLSEQLNSMEIKTVFFSSYQEFEYAKSALQNNVFDYLIKPIKFDELYRCFERLREKLDKEQSQSLIYATKADRENQYGAVIQKVLEYIDENYRDATLEEAARHVYMTPSYLSKLFKERVGMNFSEYLQDAKMKQACRMLCDNQYKLYEIAGRVGYDNPKNFTRAFKLRYQMTPSEYRNSHS